MKNFLKRIFKNNKNFSDEELVSEINKLYKDFKFMIFAGILGNSLPR